MHNNIDQASGQAHDLSDARLKRKTADIIAPWLDKHLTDAQRSRYRHCGDYLAYLEDEAREHRKLDIGYFCGIRLCPGCAWRESVRTAERVAAISAAMADSGWSMLMVTLTVPNVTGDRLRRTIQHINSSWSRLCKRKRYAAWANNIRKIEVTYNRYSDTYHPHLHCIVYVRAGYYRGQSYVSHAQLLADWREVTNQPEITQVDIRRCRNRDHTNAILEVSKYTAKSSDYSKSEQVLDTMYSALHHTRIMTYAGIPKNLCIDYEAGRLDRYRVLDTTRYTMRVVYVWQRMDDGSWAYKEHDVQPYSMDAAEADRLAQDEQRAITYALQAAKRQEDWAAWLRMDWVRTLRDAEPDEIEVIE